MTYTPRNAEWVGHAWLFGQFFPKTCGDLQAHPAKMCVTPTSFFLKGRACHRDRDRTLSQTHIDYFKIKTFYSAPNHSCWSSSGELHYVYSLGINVKSAFLAWPTVNCLTSNLFRRRLFQCTYVHVINSVYGSVHFSVSPPEVSG